MTVTVVPATAADEPVLRSLVQLYAYDFSEIMGMELPDSGRFRDAIADGCFVDGGHRHPFLLRADDKLAGFAIVDTRSRLTGEAGVRDMAEFFVARHHRGHGVGDAAARALFDRFGGRWEVRQTARNRAALAFWRKVIGRYTGGRFAEAFLDGPTWTGPVQSFTSPVPMPEPPVVRALLPGDLAVLWVIFSEIVAAGGTLAEDASTTFADFETSWTGRGGEQWVAVVGSRIVGGYTVRPNHPGRGAHVGTASYLVASAARGAGVGHALGAHSIARATALGFAALQFNFVVATNTAAVRLWERLGFRTLARLPGAYQHAELGPVDALVMFRELP